MLHVKKVTALEKNFLFTSRPRRKTDGCRDIRRNNCAFSSCNIQTKQFCAKSSWSLFWFLRNLNNFRIRLHHLHIFFDHIWRQYLLMCWLTVTNRKKTPKQLLVSVFCSVYAVLIQCENSVQLDHSSCFLRKNCSAESHWSLGKRFDSSQKSSWETASFVLLSFSFAAQSWMNVASSTQLISCCRITLFWGLL